MPCRRVWLVCSTLSAASAPGGAEPPVPAQVIAAGAIQPHAALDPAGNVHVVFLQGGNVAVATSRDEGRTFSTPVIAIDAGGRAQGGKQRGPRVGSGGRGRLFVTAPVTFDPAEHKRKYPTAELYAVISSDGGTTWSRPRRINSAEKKAPEALHWLAVDRAGVAHVAWLDLRGRVTPGQDLYYTRIAGDTVEPDRLLATMVCECCAPGLAVDTNGRAFAAWREGGDKPSREIVCAQVTGEGPLHGRQVNFRPTRLSICPMSAPAVAVSADGAQLGVAWMDESAGPGERRVYWSIPGQGGGATVVEPVDPTGGGTQDHPALVLGPDGVFWSAWDVKEPDSRRTVRFRASPRPASPARAGDGAFGSCAYPALAASGERVVLVFETRREGEPGAVAFQRLR